MKYQLGLILVLCTISLPALAYIDPGMGSMWLQTIIAILAGCGVTLKLYWQRFKHFLFRTKKQDLQNQNLVNKNQIGNYEGE